MIALHILCSSCPYSVLEIEVPHLSTEWKYCGKEDAFVFVKVSRMMVSVQHSSEQQVGRVCWQGRTGTAIITCMSNLVFSVLEISAHLCFLLIAKYSRVESSFPFLKRILEWMCTFIQERASVYLGIGQIQHMVSRWQYTEIQFIDLILGVICGISSLCLYIYLGKRLSPALTDL